LCDIPRGGGFPNQTVVAQGHQKQTICIMAGPHMGGSQSEETLKGHGRKTRSRLRSTKATPQSGVEEESEEAMKLTRPPTKQKEAIIRIYDLSDEAERLVYTDQTRRFPQKSSRGNQYIMVLIKIDRNAILVEAMKNHTTGEMI